MTIEEYNQRLEGVIEDIRGGAHADILVRLANDAIAMIRDRVQQRGLNPEGQQYAPYSTKPMLSGSKNMTMSAFNRIAGSKTKRRDLDWVTIKGKRLFNIPGGYKEFRELHGRQTGYVDFTFTGRMMANIALAMDRGQLAEGVAVIKPQNEKEMKKLAGNEERRGKILMLSEDEIKEVKEDYKEGIYQIWVKNGLGL